MSKMSRYFLYVFLLHVFAGEVVGDSSSSASSRLDFPPGFVFGAGTSAYQVEGAAAEDGRKPSVWDTFAHDGRSPYKGTGDMASDQYHKYKDDVKLMHKMGLEAYRFSISWSRLIPDGHGAVNTIGLSYYNNLIDELVSYRIEPHVTLSHFDIPQTLQDAYEGFLSQKFIKDFTAYAEVCFREYGDRVKSWMTFNEPNILTVNGYGLGTLPPGRCSYPFGANCTKGDSTTEPYLAAHNILLSHAAAVNLYRTKYQENQKGKIGVTLLAFWFEPLTSSPLNIASSERALDFHLGWFLDPLVHGRYPTIMRTIVGSRLPTFTENNAKQLKGSFDFIGLNHYIGFYVEDLPRTSDEYGSDYVRDLSVKISLPGLVVSDFTRLRALGTPEMPIMVWALQKMLEYVKMKYKNPPVVIHENGYVTVNDGLSDHTTHNDTKRIQYLQSYIQSLVPSMRNGSSVAGYFMWSFVDCFEPVGGYRAHYGLYGVDFTDKDRKRYPRTSAHWYSIFLAKTKGKKTLTSSYVYSE